MVLQVISSTPSPYARKVRIQLLEKDIPFELKTEVPWDHTTQTPEYNPLEKLPVLIFDDGREPIYDSSFILSYVEQKFEPKESLTPSDLDTKLEGQQLEVLANTVCDALVLFFFEQERGDRKSEEWSSRQSRKIDGGVKALAQRVEKRQGDFVLGSQLSTTDITIVSMVDFLRLNEHPVLKPYKDLCQYADKLNERKAFKETLPYMFDIKDKIV